MTRAAPLSARRAPTRRAATGVAATVPAVQIPVDPRPDIAALEGYHSAQVDVDIRLNTNESPFAPPESFVDAWLDRVRASALHRYPDRAAAELREGIARQFGQPTERVFVANGSNEVLQSLLLAYAGFERTALVFEPTYALHSHITRITGTNLAVAPRGKNFEIGAAAASLAVARYQPNVTFVCNPNNPTGTVEPFDTVDAIASATTGLVVIDEAYGEFAAESMIDRVDEQRPFVVVRTFSKVWSLAGVRLGFCIAPEWAVTELEKVALPYRLSVASQLAGVEALAFQAEMRDRVGRLVEERERLYEALAAKPSIDVFPSGANFLLFRAAGSPDPGRGRALWQHLLDQSVLVRDFSHWPGVEGCLRVTVGTPEENDAFLAALATSEP